VFGDAFIIKLMAEIRIRNYTIKKELEEQAEIKEMKNEFV
jgi:hypothetical protein